MQKLEKYEAEHSKLNRKVEEEAVMLTDKRDEWKDSVTNDKIQHRLKEEEVEREEQENRRNSLNESCSTEAEVSVADDVEKIQDIMHELELGSTSRIRHH